MSSRSLRATSPSVIATRRLRPSRPSCGSNQIDRRNSQTLLGCALVRGWGPEGPPGSGKRDASIIRLVPGRARQCLAHLECAVRGLVIECTTSDFPTRSAVCKLRADFWPGPPYILRSSESNPPETLVFRTTHCRHSATRVSLTRQRCWETALGHSRTFHVFETRPQLLGLRITCAAGL
jgi:hypothetical protein